MTIAPDDLLGKLNDDVSRRGLGEQARIIREVANLFMEHHKAYPASQVELFDSVMMKIIDKVDEAARAYLSDRLALVDVAPLQTVRRLASDDAIRVAGPVLAQSKCLDEAFLVDSAQTKSQDHLLAISQRQAIGPRVTDILIDRGDDKVVLTLARNDGAELSDRGYSAAVERARDNGQLAVALSRRTDILRQQLLSLIDKASQEVRQRLEAEAEIRVQEILAIVDSANRELKGRTLQMSEGYARATARLAALKNTGGVSESHIFAFARERQFEEVVVALSELARLPLSDIEKIVAEGFSDRCLVLSRALGLSWPCVLQIARMAIHEPLAAERVSRLKQKYQALSRQDAAKILQFHQLRQRARAVRPQAS